jgi:muramoyltetrapeptide carboxypeptidase
MKVARASHPTERRRPPRLAPGARIALVAPAGPLRDELDLQRAVDNVRSFGWEPVSGKHVLSREGYLAGSDAQRLADLQSAMDDPSIDGIWCLRGGYGSIRLLSDLETDSLASRSKSFIGFSDITVLHSYLGERCGMVTFHGPVARAELTLFSRHSMECALVRGENSCGKAAAAMEVRPGVARGRLAGGNLALLASLCGTPWAPDLRGAIVVIEDVNEPLYRLDRMFQQLIHSGMLDECAGLVFGDFSSDAVLPGGPEDQQTLHERKAMVQRLDAVLAEVTARMAVPALAHLPVGHIDDQWTIPLGAVAELDTGALSLNVMSAESS